MSEQSLARLYLPAAGSREELHAYIKGLYDDLIHPDCQASSAYESVPAKECKRGDNVLLRHRDRAGVLVAVELCCIEHIAQAQTGYGRLTVYLVGTCLRNGSLKEQMAKGNEIVRRLVVGKETVDGA